MHDVYFISGLGANRHAFDYLRLEARIRPHFIEWKIPEKGETLSHYAARMAEVIDPKQAFSLVGLSFGGLVAQEMNRYVQPIRTVLISSIKSRAELPKLMKFSAKTQAHQAISKLFFSRDALLNALLSNSFQKTLHKCRLPNLDLFFTHLNPYYLKWAVDQVVNWDCPIEVKDLVQLHGTADWVFPAKYIKGATLIHGGTHLMIIQRARAVSAHLNRLLSTGD